MKKEMTFEEALKRLEEITVVLESGEKSLEESIKLYEEGAELSAFCQKSLKDAEKKISALTNEKDGE